MNLTNSKFSLAVFGNNTICSENFVERDTYCTYKMKFKKTLRHIPWKEKMLIKRVCEVQYIRKILSVLKVTVNRRQCTFGLSASEMFYCVESVFLLKKIRVL